MRLVSLPLTCYYKVMRLKVIRWLYIITVSLVVLRLAYWQVVKADELSAKAEGQRTLTYKVVAPRGDILFADGSILAASQPMYALYAQPKVIEDKFKEGEKINAKLSAINAYKKSFAQTLAEALSRNISPLEASTEAELKGIKLKTEESFLSQLERDLSWVNLNKTVDLETKKRLEKLNLVGLGFEPTTGRFYPEGSSSAHLLGFVSKDAYGNEKGYFGIEGYYDGELRGSYGQVSEEKDALGLPILIGKFFNKEPKPGKTITLNIDRTIQYAVEQKLKTGIEKYQAKGASAVVMDPQTGSILAMASLPSYDPALTAVYPKENFKNPVTADAYEPGSTFKTVIMAGALDAGSVDDSFRCEICTGPVVVSNYLIRTWNSKYYPNSTLSDILIHSDNVGMVNISRKMGKEVEVEAIKKFGFGSLTGIDVQDEFTPDLRPDDSWKEIDLATASFGQGISATPLQVVRAVSAIANGGNLMEPHVVKKIEGDGKVFEIKPKVVSKPVSLKTSLKIREMMVRAVEAGESQLAKVKGYKVAGKTGTSQVPINGYYDPTKTIASFVGFAPAENPRFVMLVRYLEPRNSLQGAETAAPTFMEIAREIFNYYGIPPSE